MITKLIATECHHNQVFEHVTLKNADGTPVRCRKTGQCKTWKTRPDEFKLPVKHGLKTCFYITQDNAHKWTMQRT